MQSKRIKISTQTRTNWLIDAAVFVGALLASLSGIYFLFARHTWSDVHTWGGVLMIAAAVIHIAIHYKWINMTARRVLKAARSESLAACGAISPSTW